MDGSAIRRVLWVCTANRTRSVAGEILMSRHAHEDGVKIDVSSAGVSAREGHAMDNTLSEMLDKRHLLDGVEFASRPLNAELVDQADLILCAERSHALHVATEYAGNSHKLQVFRPFAKAVGQPDRLAEYAELAASPLRFLGTSAEEDLADPTGLRARAYRRMLATIDRGSAAIVTWIGQGQPIPWSASHSS